MIKNYNNYIKENNYYETFNKVNMYINSFCLKNFYEKVFYLRFINNEEFHLELRSNFSVLYNIKCNKDIISITDDNGLSEYFNDIDELLKYLDEVLISKFMCYYFCQYYIEIDDFDLFVKTNCLKNNKQMFFDFLEKKYLPKMIYLKYKHLIDAKNFDLI